jgi:hypothetical protein
MSEEQTAATAETADAATTTSEAATASWDELFKGENPEKVRKSLDHAREWEKRAKDNAQAAKRLAEIEDAQKSEAQKAAERVADLESQVAQANASALRFKVASQFGIGSDDADLFLTGSDEETLTKQAERLTSRAEERKKQGNLVPSEGTPVSPPGDSDAAFAKKLFEA